MDISSVKLFPVTVQIGLCRIRSETKVLEFFFLKRRLKCFFFSLGRYLDDYIASPGTVSMTTADSTIPSVTSSDDCAKQCTQSKSLACQSFEYCQDSKQCLLFNGLTLGHVSGEASSPCQQFKSKLI